MVEARAKVVFCSREPSFWRFWPATILLSGADGGGVFGEPPSLPLDTPHRPAVDVLFQSAAEVFGNRVLGVVMSGMGSYGTKGAAWIKAQGGTILTEARRILRRLRDAAIGGGGGVERPGRSADRDGA